MTGIAEQGSGYIVGAKLVVNARSSRPREQLLRTAVVALGKLSGRAFVPEGRLNAAFLAGARRATRVNMTHPRLTASDVNSWVSLSVDTYEPHPWEVVFLNIHVEDSGEALNVAWEVGRAVMPRLVTALNPAVAFMNAWSLDGDGTTLPTGAPGRDRAVPPVFTAWTYVGGDQGADVLRILAELPAAESTPLGTGWLVRAVNDVRDAPTHGFISSLQRLGETAATYQPPILEP